MSEEVDSSSISTISTNIDNADVSASSTATVSTVDVASTTDNALSSDSIGAATVDQKAQKDEKDQRDDEASAKDAKDDKEETKEDAKEPPKTKKPKPRILSEKKDGIYTVQRLASDHFFLLEFYKGLRVSAPYLARVIKTYWSLSPARVSLFIGANIGKAILPSLSLWVKKGILDEVQRATEGKKVPFPKLAALIVLKLALYSMQQGLEVLTDHIDKIMGRKLARVLDTELVESYLKLDADQIGSKAVKKKFAKAKSFAGHDPTKLIVRLLDFVRYFLTIVSSAVTVSTLLSKNAKTLIVLNMLKAFAHLYRLVAAYSGSKRYIIQNKAYHRLELMKGFALNQHLRRDINVTGIENWITKEIRTADEELGDTHTKHPYYRRASSTVSHIRYLVVNFIDSLEYSWLIYAGLKRGMSLGTLHLIRSSTDQVVDMLWNLTWAADSATDDWKNLVAYYQCLSIKPEMQAPENPVAYVPSSGGMKIEARAIRYKYDPKKEDILKGTSFVVNSGEMVAVVGFNGAGKSTLAKLLARLANVTDGELLINDEDVKTYHPQELRRHIAVLFQDIRKYSGLTILENIGVGNVEHMNSEEAVQESAVNSGAAEFIDKLPFKYDSYIGFAPGADSYSWHSGRWDSDSESDSDDEDTAEDKKRVQKNISGGQWQKIALARAFMRGTKADLLILDEPTANLDPEAEHKLFETIKKIRKGRTTVYISHRFNTVRAADRIMFMEDGEVKEFGTHDELMALKDGRYHRLYTLQAKGFLLDDKGGVTKDVDGMIVNVGEDVVKTVIETEE